ncbi:histone-lysine N-methyltransferase SMYD3 [Anguilla rostrata]|uniref:histone-lysine N-methyltransferase SMYD3 n=1 Tax=Anguilla rostrata TaxID=7938 RepID=UPI0030CF70CC
MAQKVERFCSPGKGNGLRAVSSLKAGELLFSAEPFACTVSKRVIKSTCENCLSRKDKLRRCSQCKIAHYCNASCQKRSWPEHREECRRLQRLHPTIPTDSVRLVAKILSKLVNRSHGPAEKLYSLEELESHLSDVTEEKRSQLEDLGVALRLYLKEEADCLSELPPGLDPISVIAKVTCNCFSISDGELQEVGVGLYPSVSLLNHACRPNCVMVFEGRILRLRAVRDIRPLEELTISYTDVMTPSQDRRKRLREQYCFLCECERCVTADKDSDMLSGPEEDWMSLQHNIPRLELLQSEQKWEEVLRESQALSGSRAGTVPDRNVYLLRVLDFTLDACINLAQWDQALEFGTRTLQPYRLYYPDPHPARAIQLMRVGKLQHFLGRLAEAQETLRQAYDVMKVTHGEEHALTVELTSKLEEIRAEMDSS